MKVKDIRKMMKDLNQNLDIPVIFIDENKNETKFHWFGKIDLPNYEGPKEPQLSFKLVVETK